MLIFIVIVIMIFGLIYQASNRDLPSSNSSSDNKTSTIQSKNEKSAIESPAQNSSHKEERPAEDEIAKLEIVVFHASKGNYALMLHELTHKSFYPLTVINKGRKAVFDQDAWFDYYTYEERSVSDFGFSHISKFNENQPSSIKSVIIEIVAEMKELYALFRTDLDEKLSPTQKEYIEKLKKKQIGFYLVPANMLTYDFCWAAVQINAKIIDFIPDKHKTPELVQLADVINEYGERFKYSYGEQFKYSGTEEETLEDLMMVHTRAKASPHPGIDQECRVGDLYDQFDYYSDH